MTWFSGVYSLAFSVSRKAAAKRDCVFLGLITEGKGRSISSMQTPRRYPEGWPRANGGLVSPSLPPSCSSPSLRFMASESHCNRDQVLSSLLSLFVVRRLLLPDSVYRHFSLPPFRFSLLYTPPSHTPLYCLRFSSPPAAMPFYYHVKYSRFACDEYRLHPFP